MQDTQDMQANPESNHYISQRLRLHYVDWGNPGAPPLLLLHGGRDHCRNWDWTARALAGRFHILASDWRGHGDSDWSADGEYKLQGYVFDLAQLIQQQGLGPVTIVGHSMGGHVALRYAGLYPDLVRRLVVIEGLGLSPRLLAERDARDCGERIREWIGQKRASAGRTPRRYATPADAILRMQEENRHLSAAQARHLTLHGLRRHEDGGYGWKFDPYLNLWADADLPQAVLETLWSRITAPTLLLYGTESGASNPETDGRLGHFRNARVELYEGAGHWLHHERQQRFLADLDSFL